MLRSPDPEIISPLVSSAMFSGSVPCHHGMARPQVADEGDGLQIGKVAANILNKQSRTADRGRPSSLGVGRGDKNSPPYNI
jgi:hypothetical protein